MGLLFILIGLIIALTLSWFWGLVMVIVGIFLVFIPGTPYGYGWYQGRRGPP